MSLGSTRLIAVASIAALTFASPARAQAPTYDVAYLGTAPGATSTLPRAINDHGVVVGDAEVAFLKYAPFVASDGNPPTFLPLLPGHTAGMAAGINNAGVIVGSSGPFHQGDVCVIWTPGPSGYVVTPLPQTANGKQPTRARGLNELGDVVGELGEGGGFAWTAAGGTVDVTTLGLSGIASDVNERRQIVVGHQRMDLDTLVVDTATMADSWGFGRLNDAGTATWARIQTIALGQFQGDCGTWEFGVGPTTYGVTSFIAATGGIDYATTVPYTHTVQSVLTHWLHVEGVGNFTLESCLDPASPGWEPKIDTACCTSANGLIAVLASNATLGVSGPILLTPQRFHAILEGAPGIEGLPVLAGEGSLQANTPVTFRLSHAAPSAPVGLIAGLSRVDLPFYGGMLVPAPTLVLTGLSTDANGKLTLAASWPSGLPSGTQLYLQEWVVDASAPFGIAGSNALECVTP